MRDRECVCAAPCKAWVSGPPVYRLAREACLGGFVRNDSEGCVDRDRGRADALAWFTEACAAVSPVLARIESIEIVDVALARRA